MAPSSADTKQNGLGWNLNEMLDHEVDIDTTSYHLVQTKVNMKCIPIYSCFHMYIPQKAYKFTMNPYETTSDSKRSLQ